MTRYERPSGTWAISTPRPLGPRYALALTTWSPSPLYCSAAAIAPLLVRYRSPGSGAVVTAEVTGAVLAVVVEVVVGAWSSPRLIASAPATPAATSTARTIAMIASRRPWRRARRPPVSSASVSGSIGAVTATAGAIAVAASAGGCGGMVG